MLRLLPLTEVLARGGVLIIKTYGFDSYNQTVELETAQPLRSHGGGDEMPKVMIVQSEPIAFKDDITVKFDGGALRSPSTRCTGNS